MRSLSKALLPAVVSASLWVGCAGSVRVHEDVVIAAPPPDRVEVMTVAPSPDHVWVNGHWQWAGASYAWVPGHWAARPHPHAAWVPGRWRARPRGWVWINGHWDT